MLTVRCTEEQRSSTHGKHQYRTAGSNLSATLNQAFELYHHSFATVRRCSQRLLVNPLKEKVERALRLGIGHLRHAGGGNGEQY